MPRHSQSTDGNRSRRFSSRISLRTAWLVLGITLVASVGCESPPEASSEVSLILSNQLEHEVVTVVQGGSVQVVRVAAGEDVLISDMTTTPGVPDDCQAHEELP